MTETDADVSFMFVSNLAGGFACGASRPAKPAPLYQERSRASHADRASKKWGPRPARAKATTKSSAGSAIG
jgi:hypothetical protein